MFRILLQKQTLLQPSYNKLVLFKSTITTSSQQKLFHVMSSRSFSTINSNDSDQKLSSATAVDQSNRTNVHHSIVQHAFETRFGKQKRQLMVEWLVMDSVQLMQQCMQFNIQLDKGDNSELLTKQSSQIMQLLVQYLDGFERAAITQHAQQTQTTNKTSNNSYQEHPSTSPPNPKHEHHSTSPPDPKQEHPSTSPPSPQQSITSSPMPSKLFGNRFKDKVKSKQRELELKNTQKVDDNPIVHQKRTKTPLKTSFLDDNYKMEEISKAIKDIENKYGPKNQESKPARGLFNRRDESPEEPYMKVGPGNSYRDIIDVPLGPMRKLKPAPLFSLMATQGVWEPIIQRAQGSSLGDSAFPDPQQLHQGLDTIFEFNSKSEAEMHNLSKVGNNKQDQELLDVIKGKLQLANLNFNPDLRFNELKTINTQSKEFTIMLSYAASNISRLSRENKDYIIRSLKMIDKLPKEYWSQIQSTPLAELIHLSLNTKTSMPNLLNQLTVNPDFMSQSMLKQNEIDEVAICVVSLIKMAQQDFQLIRTNQGQFEKTLGSIQGKVENIQEHFMSETGQKSALISENISKLEPQQLLNRLVLFPSPPEGSRMQKLLGTSLKALVKADMGLENEMKGQFNQCERNYILARGMQVLNDKDLQNDLRILATEQKNTSIHNIASEALNSCYITSGKILEDSQLNNVHHLAGILPPTVRLDTHTVDQIQNQSRIDTNQILSIRRNLGRQIYTCNTREVLHQMIESMEFTQKYAPLSVYKNNNGLQRHLQTVATSTARFQFSLNDLIRLQNLLLVSMERPTFLFDEILAHKDSLATAVDKPVLKIFIENTLSRMMQHEVIFDHLANSISDIHRKFLPYQQETFHVLSKILSDLVAEGGTNIPLQNFALINKILSLEKVTTKVFDSSDQAKSVLEPFLTQQLEHLQGQQNQIFFKNAPSQIEHLKTYDAIFKALRAIKPLVSSEPDMLLKIAKSVEVAIGNLMRELNLFSVETSLQENSSTKMQTFKRSEQFPLDELIKTNKSILDAISSLDGSHSSRVMMSYLDQTPLSAIIDRTLSQHLRERQELTTSMADQEFFESATANKLINQAIELETWDKIERLGGPLITYFNQVLDANVFQQDQKLAFIGLAERFVLKMRNSRCLYGVDLARFFKLMRQLQESNYGVSPELFDEVIMNVSCNLRTLGVNLLFQVEEDSNAKSIETDNLFKEENADRIEKERQYKHMIFDMYKEVFARSPEFFSASKNYTLSPLSVIFAELFDNIGFEERILCLKMLGSHSIDRYTEEFIQKLYDNYSHQHQIQALLDEDIEKFINLVDWWPKFLQNNVLLNQLSTIDASTLSIGDQSRVLMVQTNKNLVIPKFIKHHFIQFIALNDKDVVKKYMTNFLQSIAYVGFTEDINMNMATQVLRRIYKEPKNVETGDLLNFLVAMAVSQARYQDFDAKSREFVEKTLDLIEKEFTGTKQITVDGDNDKKLEMYLFNTIPSPKKSYNKILDKNTPDFESTLTNDGKREYFQQTESGHSRPLKYSSANDLDEEVLQDDLTDFNVPIDDDEAAGAKDGDDPRNKRVYDRGAAENKSSFNEEHNFNIRSKKMLQLAKQDNHLLLYSNVNILDFVDINSSNVAKAWTILFHFRGKSVESMLFEEFNSIVQRNAITKTKNHDVFNQIYLELNQECYKANLKMDLAGSCEETGWPIDIALSHFNSYQKPKSSRKSEKEGVASKLLDMEEEEKQLQFAVYFLLQEEICYNSQTHKEEPLGLQKLMLRHLQQISNFKVCTIDENQAALDIDGAIASIQEEFYPVLSTPRRSGKRDKRGGGYNAPVLAKMSEASNKMSLDSAEGGEVPFSLNNDDDFITVSESEEEVDDIVGMPQNML